MLDAPVLTLDVTVAGGNRRIASARFQAKPRGLGVVVSGFEVWGKEGLERVEGEGWRLEGEGRRE